MKPCCYSHSEKRPFVGFQLSFSSNCFPSSYLSGDNIFLIAGLITGKVNYLIGTALYITKEPILKHQQQQLRYGSLKYLDIEIL